jgi:SPX domain protein involved in polyphosphate accumulation
MIFKVPADARYEIKFVAHELEYQRLLLWVRQHPSCFFNEYPDRQVNNVYFDSHNYRSYDDNISGSSSRIKVRYRWYGSSIQPAKGRLEIKCKRNQFSWKIVYNVNESFAGPEKNWREMQSHLIEQLPVAARQWLTANPVPVLINRYQRKYFRTRNDDVRVTLDSDLRIFDQTRNPYPNYSIKANTPRTFVLEVKFPRDLRNKASQIIKNIPIRVSRHSKYIVGFNSISEF